MKKIVLFSAFSALFFIGSTSCSKCRICTKKDEPAVHVCEKYYPTHTAFQTDLTVYESKGYGCRNSF